MNKINKFICTFCVLLYAKIVYSDTDPLVFSTKECHLTEPIYGHKFDFNSLHSELAHVVKNNKDDIFQFNLCGNLSRTCDGQNNVAACLIRNGKEYILGRQHELHYRNGKMFFEFSNGSACPSGGGEYKLNIVIGCDYTIDKEQATVTGYGDKDCSFFITFETELACLPEPEITKNSNCSVKDPKTDHIYDLLSLSDVNYRISDRNGSEFIINVCKPVLYGENALCPPASSICYNFLKNTDYKKKFNDYGSVSSNPVIENGQLMLKHNSLIKCNQSLNYTSIVKFYCDENAKNAHPEFVGVQNCIYEFSFATPLACNNIPDCAVITHNNEILDMSSLKNHRYSLNVNDKNYTFAICSAAGPPCMEKNGACFAEGIQSTSLGEMNSNLRFNQSGSAYLLYENGAPCQPENAIKSPASTNPSIFWSTKIEFVCAPNATKINDVGNNNSLRTNANEQVAAAAVAATGTTEGPKIIENSNCQLLIQYQTRLACQEQISCKTKVYVDHSEDGSGLELVDLTPLMSFKENYEATIDLDASSEQKLDKSTKFFLNVCRPLVSKYGLGCPGGSAACMAKQGPTTPEEEQSLGYPEAGLVGINRTNVELRYFNGDTCKEDNKSKMSTRIDFHCDMRAGRGRPVLRDISDCHYRFDWATNVICPAHMCTFDETTCAIQNLDINESYSLKKAPYTQNGVMSLKDGKNVYNLNLCDSHHKAVTDYSQGLVNLFFSTQASCGQLGTMNVQMRLICSNQTKTIPTFSQDCSLMLIQQTPDICKFLGLDIPDTDKPHADTTTSVSPTSKPNESHPAEHTANIGTILVAILSLTFFMACAGLFAFSPERREALKRLFGGNALRVRYRRVRSNEEANLLLDTNEYFSDSDDDMLL